MLRFAPTALSLLVLLGLASAPALQAQDAPKTDAPKAAEKKSDAPSAPEAKPEAPKPEASKTETAPAEAKKPEAPKAEEPKAAEPPLPTIPPEVEAKLEAARKAVAEAIVAAQDAGLVETSIDPPPILDILITGRAIDARELKRDPKDRKGVSPEVFGAWYTGFGKIQGITPEKDVRIVYPTRGLKDWYNERARILTHHIEAVRKAKEPAKGGEPAPKKDDSKKDDSKKSEAPGTAK